MEKEIINVDYNSHKIVADIMPTNSEPQVLCLHGAGISNRKIFDSLRRLLGEDNISSCALDFIGYGDTGGELNQSSLKSRTEQAQAVIEKAKVVTPLVIIAGSMAGYNAIKLTEIYPVDLLVFSAPAIYNKDEYEIPFGDEFSSLIQQQRSLDQTDAWSILNNFKGKLVVLASEKDEIIPFEITKKIYDSAINAAHREILVIPDASHRLVSYLSEHMDDLKMVVDKMIELMK